MRQNFDDALARVLVHEGGYVNDPRDPGGATNKGVTQAVYDDWRRSHGLSPRTVRLLGEAELEAIYEGRYWDAIRGDDLPAGVDYAVFDLAVNSGVNRAARFLQRAVGVTEDGKIGPVTLAAVRGTPPLLLVREICKQRLAFLRSLSTFDRFGKGWSRRVADVQTVAEAMA